MDSFASSASRTPSTPGGTQPPALGQDFADEPIHIINVSLQYEELEGCSDAKLVVKCYKFVQVMGTL